VLFWLVALILVAVVVWRISRRRGGSGYRPAVEVPAATVAAPPGAVENPRTVDPPAAAATPPVIAFRGGPVTEAQVVAALRECYDPEIPIDIYELGLVYGIDIDPDAIAVRMTLTSRDCPSARSIPEDVKRRISALGQENVSVEIVWDPPWHPSRISAEGKEKLGLG
jgi:metal-sulfur cluster biosynthetic enzyme